MPLSRTAVRCDVDVVHHLEDGGVTRFFLFFYFFTFFFFEGGEKKKRGEMDPGRSDVPELAEIRTKIKECELEMEATRQDILARTEHYDRKKELLMANMANIGSQDARIQELRLLLKKAMASPLNHAGTILEIDDAALRSMLRISEEPPASAQSLNSDTQAGRNRALEKRIVQGLSSAVASVVEASKNIVDPQDGAAVGSMLDVHKGDVEVTVILEASGGASDYEVCTVNLNASTIFRDVMRKVMSYWSLDPDGHTLVDPNGYCWPLEAKVIPTLKAYQTQFNDTNNLIRVHRDATALRSEGRFALPSTGEFKSNAKKDKASAVNEIVDARGIELHHIVQSEDVDGKAALSVKAGETAAVADEATTYVGIDDDRIPGLVADKENSIKSALDATRKEHEWLYQIRKRNKMRNPIWPRMHCEMFVLFLLTAFFANAVIFRRRVSTSYKFKVAIEDAIIQPRAVSTTNGIPPALVKCDSIQDFWEWTRNVLGDVITVPSFNRTNNQTAISLYSQTYLVGSMRMKQMRVKDSNCSTALANVQELKGGCAPFAASTTSFSTETFGGPDVPISVASAFEYDSNQRFEYLWPFIWTGSFRGLEGFYNLKEGGFQIELPFQKDDYNAMIDNLMENNWFDDKTEAVFININFFNTNADMLGVVNILFEVTIGGSISVRYTIDVARISPTSSEFDYVRAGLETAAFAIFVCFVLLRSSTQLKNLFGLVGFSNKSSGDKSMIKQLATVSNVEKVASLALDVVLLMVFCFAFAAMHSERKYDARFIEACTQNGYSYTDANGIVGLTQTSNAVDGSLLLLLCFRILGYFSFAPSLSTIWEAADFASHSFASFLFILVIVFLAFGSLGYFIFGTQDAAFSYVDLAFGSIMSMSAGSFRYQGALLQYPFGGFLFMAIFYIVSSTLLSNMFTVLIIHAYSKVMDQQRVGGYFWLPWSRAELARQSEHLLSRRQEKHEGSSEKHSHGKKATLEVQQRNMNSTNS